MADARLIDMQKEHSLILIKPDAVRRGLIGEVISRIERRGFEIVALKTLLATEEQLSRHYEEHASKSFYGSLVEYMTSGPIVAVIVEGDRVVEAIRNMTGATNPAVAAPGTIRGDFGRDWGNDVVQNILHASDSPVSAEREKLVWFDNLDQ